MIPKEQSGELKNGVEPSPCETSSVAGQCQAKLYAAEIFWVYLSQRQVTFCQILLYIQRCDRLKIGMTGKNLEIISQDVLWYENSFRIDWSTVS